MGQIIERYNRDIEFGIPSVDNRRASIRRLRRRYHPCHRPVPAQKTNTFVDLNLIPPELALSVLSHLGATDLCLASCVWRDLACDEFLWQSLCHQTWPFCSAYKNIDLPETFSFRKLYLRLDEARLTFNADAFEGIAYMTKYGLLDDNVDDVVAYFHTAPGIDPIQKRRFLQKNPSVLSRLMELKSYHKHVLPNALRRLFCELPAPVDEPGSMQFVTSLVSKFSARFVACNPDLGLTEDEVYMLCFSLIMLSTDLWSPHVKNKMSKREFIRNTRHATRTLRDDFLGHLYDNVYMVGHVVLSDLPGPPTPHPAIRSILV
ncbi:F-box only protein 8 [Fasciola gigantica]|uniref:F-box only protein 8 n=1 Tax=Fasciola gigantica TaxID=46835 RepID=A0A504Z2A3_FASGI|nr:F-box only protein 8 [Fasciola gigantica]